MLELLTFVIFWCGGPQHIVVDKVVEHVAVLECLTTGTAHHVFATTNMQEGMLVYSAERIRQLQDMRNRIPRARSGDMDL